MSISGHTHNPLRDPRSIWQGEFTAIDASTLSYGTIDLRPCAANQISCLLPFGHESVGFLLAEVFADRIIFRLPPLAVAPGGRYRCRIAPVGCFGAEGTTLDWRFAIKPDYPLRSDAPNCLPE